MTFAEVGAVAGFGSLAIHLYRLARDRPRLRVFVSPCRADGSYARGGTGLTHLRFEALSVGGQSIVLGGYGVAARARVAPEPDESGGLGGWQLQGADQTTLAPGHRHRALVQLNQPICELRHELDAIWAEDSQGQRFYAPARRVNAIQDELTLSYCLERP